MEKGILEERKRISREIHDSLAQDISSLIVGLGELQLMIEECKDEGELEAIKKKVAELTGIAQNVYDALRSFISELRLPCSLDQPLERCIEEILDEFSKTSGIKKNIEELEIKEDVERHIKHEIIRIIQESLKNIYKHAEASQVNLRVTTNDKEKILNICIVDDGKGFDIKTMEKAEGLGLKIMQERTAIVGGTMKILSNPGKGTELHISIPISTEERLKDEYDEDSAGR